MVTETTICQERRTTDSNLFPWGDSRASPRVCGAMKSCIMLFAKTESSSSCTCHISNQEEVAEAWKEKLTRIPPTSGEWGGTRVRGGRGGRGESGGRAGRRQTAALAVGEVKCHYVVCHKRSSDTSATAKEAVCRGQRDHRFRRVRSTLSGHPRR